MGVMRFLVRPVELLADWPEKHRAYLSGMDQFVWPTRVDTEGEYLVLRRTSSDSAKLNIPWSVPGFGEQVVTTSSLPERDQPYLLPLELARGKIVQVRNQAAAWQHLGMALPGDYVDSMRAAFRLFARAASSQDDRDTASALALEALSGAFQAAERLTRSYTSQRLENRHRQYPQLPTALGCSLGSTMLSESNSAAFCEAFNAAAVPVEWRVIEPIEGQYHWEAYDQQVQWALQRGLLVRGGPLLDLSPDGLPTWLWQWEHDYWNLESFVCDFIETAVSRYLGRIRAWEVAARANTGGMLTLSEEQRLQLVAKAIDTARRADPEAQFLLRVDQPWGEYQARGQHRLSPLQFADTLVRAGLPITAINLEIAVGYSPRGSLPRDLLDCSRLIDQWSLLGIPLAVTLACPSSVAPDPLIDTDLEVERGPRNTAWTPQIQAEWVNTLLPLCLAKPAVAAVFWSHFADEAPHRFPHAGLLDAAGHPKPAHAAVVHYRRTYWRQS